MSVHFHYAYDFAKIGTARITLQEQATGTLSTYSISTGVVSNCGVYGGVEDFYHGQAFRFPGEVTDATAPARPAFVEYFLDHVNADANLSGTYTLTNFTGLRYTITGSVAFRITSNTNDLGNHLLGGISTASYKTEHASTRDIWYSRAGGGGYLSDVTDDFEGGDLAYDGETDTMLGGGVAWSKPPKFQDFSLRNELNTDTLRRSVGGSRLVPGNGTWETTLWPWQSAWEHARNDMPFMVVVDPTYNIGSNRPTARDWTHLGIHRLTAEGARWSPRREVPDWDERWTLRFKTRVLERGYDNEDY